MTGVQASLFDDDTDEPVVALDADAAARHAIATQLDTTLFVEAGAGSGKTKSLVDRVLALVTVAGVPMREIVAVTFTEKAATELRDRIRRGLEQVAAATPSDRAPTLRRGQPTRSTTSTAPRCRRCTRSRSACSWSTRSRPGCRRASRCSTTSRRRWPSRSAGTASSTASSTTRPSNDRCCSRSPPASTGRSSARSRWRATRTGTSSPPGWGRSTRRRRSTSARCSPPSTRCAPAATTAPTTTTSCSSRSATWPPGATSCAAHPTSSNSSGSCTRACRRSGASGGRTTGRAPSTTSAIRPPRCGPPPSSSHATSPSPRSACSRGRSPGSPSTRPTIRRRAGELEFHDLLVLARAVLRDPEHGVEVRRRLRERYTRLLLDEFQDTDPIQWDLAALLASGDPEAAGRRWDEIEPDPGRLFVVGDPKQSIYRFRRADIAAFLRARDTFGRVPGSRWHRRRAAPHAQLPVRRRRDRLREPRVRRPHRRRGGVAARVRAPRGRTRADRPASARRARRAPRRRAARHERPGDRRQVAGLRAGAAHRGGRRRRRGRAPGARRGVAGHAAAARRHAAPRAVPRRRHRRAAPGAHLARPARGRPRRGGHPVPHRDVVARLQHARDPQPAARAPRRRRPDRRARPRERAALPGVRLRRRRPLHVRGRAPRPVEPPGRAARVAAGRAPGGRRDAGARRVVRRPALARRQRAARPDRARAPGAGARVRARPPARPLAARAVRDRPGARVRRVGQRTGTPAPACATSSRGPTSRAPTAHASSRPCCPRPTTTRSASSPCTAPKGLEFPITVVSGTTTQAAPRSSGVQLLFPHDSDTYALRISSSIVTEEFERYVPIDEQMDFHEKLRLLYVALTRARDHLVVSVHRTDRDPPEREKRTHAELLWHAAESAPGWEAFDAAGPPHAGRHRSRRRRCRPPRRSRRGTTGAPSATACSRPAPRRGCARPPRSRVRPPPRPRPRPQPPTPGCARARATWSCRRGTRAGTAPRSAGPCTRCSRPSTSPPAPTSTPSRRRRPRPKA